MKEKRKRKKERVCWHGFCSLERLAGVDIRNLNLKIQQPERNGLLVNQRNGNGNIFIVFFI
jgi:hypothetical protein